MNGPYDHEPAAEPRWHPEAESQGREARLLGFKQDDRAANPYVKYGRNHWMYRSFVAGWCDADQDVAAGVVTGQDVR